MNAKKLGIDPDRIVGAGGSAGGTCEAMAAMSDQFEPDGEDKSISSKPNVLVLYNPALRLPNGKRVLGGQDDETLAAWKVGKSVPPMILFFEQWTHLQLPAGKWRGKRLLRGTASSSIRRRAKSTVSSTIPPKAVELDGRSALSDRFVPRTRWAIRKAHQRYIRTPVLY